MIDTKKIRNQLLIEKFRPNTLEELILPATIKSRINSIIQDDKMIPHLLLAGKTGCGKTSLGYILANMTNANLLYKNASLENTIDIIRSEILEYSKRASVNGKSYKIVFLDEIDHPNAKNLQKHILSPMEQYSGSTRFVITCNKISKLPEELIGRCQLVEFKYLPNETKDLKKAYIAKLASIFDSINVKYSLKAIAIYVEKTFPNMRKAINDLHFISKSGEISEEAVKISIYHDVDTFFNIIKSGDYQELKKYSQVMNAHVDDFYKLVYNSIEHHIAVEDIPAALIMTYNFHKESVEYPDQYININTYGLSLMEKIRFKKL